MIARVLKWRIMVYMIAGWVMSHMAMQEPVTYIYDAFIFLVFAGCFYFENKW